MVKTLNIPNLHPEQFDDFLFGTWKPVVYETYDKFHIDKIKNFKSHMNLPTLPHRRKVHFFVFITKGKMIRSKNLNEYEIIKNHFFCLPAHQITSIEYMTKDVEGFYCHFQSEVFNQPQLNIDIERDFPFYDIIAEPLVYIKNHDRVNQLLELLHYEYKNNEIKRENITALYLATLLNEINFNYSVSNIKNISASSIISQKYKHLLSTEITNIKRVVDAANVLKISPNHLNKCIKEITGQSAKELLMQMRILHAKVLLKQTDLQVQEIAFQLGGFESSDFIRFFKKRTLVTPNEYRNNNN